MEGMNSEEDRFAGCLLGLAVGDAVGTAVEFRPPGTFEPVTDMTGGGPFGLEPGQWTDDTSMALCLADSLLEAGGFDPADQMRRYVRWWREGYRSSTDRCFDIGNTVRAALARFEATGEPFSGSTDPRSAGNGSLMRLAPVAMRYAADPRDAVRLCGESSRTTHGARACVDACRYFGGLLVGALGGADKEALLSPRYAPVEGLWDAEPLCPEIDEVAAGSFKAKDPPEIQGSGYVVRSLEAALWALHRTASFREGCLLAVNLGDDADTTAAVYGQIAGACYGASGIPPEWLGRLTRADEIRRVALRLREAATSDRI
ncbi:MAG: ADP-ribosylglycohydrolase family protein [Deferrisoma sp.]